ncbi:hypothetical protein N7492_004458 [Penicillium capsulatum]|uniref:Uncharacterized protein n=1 Tax=Penicillium capsulatum TaxID=69766 RepID=A0A9W9LQZ7_9EURO|nr:hypothetical protein N7492_004458 [Penicillium capsulatum]
MGVNGDGDKGDGDNGDGDNGDGGNGDKNNGDDGDGDNPTNGGTVFAPVSASMSAPSNTETSAVATNAGNSAQAATIVQDRLPEDQFSQIPAVRFGDVLPIKLTIDGQQKPAVVDYGRQIAIPLGDDTYWLTPDDIPQPGSIGAEGSDEPCSVSSAPSSSASSSTASSTITSSTASPSTMSTTSSSSSSTNAPSSTLDCQQNIASDGPSASQVARALQRGDSFSSFGDD